jgi:hypothetical protein
VSRREHLHHLADKLGVRVHLIPALPSEFSFARNTAVPWFGAFIPRDARRMRFGGRYWEAGSVVTYGVRNLRSRGAYFTVLHELGHAAINSPSRPMFPDREMREAIVRDEALAWTWAVENAKEPLTPKVKQQMFYDNKGAFGSYLAGYGGHGLPEVRNLFGLVEGVKS